VCSFPSLPALRILRGFSCASGLLIDVESTTPVEAVVSNCLVAVISLHQTRIEFPTAYSVERFVKS